MRRNVTRHMKPYFAFGKLRPLSEIGSCANVYFKRGCHSGLREDYGIHANGNGRLSHGKWSVIPDCTSFAEAALILRREQR